MRMSCVGKLPTDVVFLRADVPKELLVSFLLSDEREKAAVRSELNSQETSKLQNKLKTISASPTGSAYHIGMVFDVSDTEHWYACVADGLLRLLATQSI